MADNTGTGTGKLFGDDLRQFMRQTVTGFRIAADIRPKAEITTTPEGQAAMRYYGKNLMPAAKAGLDFFQGAQSTGLFNGLPFTQKDYQAAIARVNDTQVAETPMAEAAKDAHAESIAARCTLAEMVLTLSQVHGHSVDHPGLPPEVKNLIKDTGAELSGHMKDISKGRKASRNDTTTLHQTEQALEEAQAKNEQHDENAAVQDAQKGLKLQVLEGEPLRPEDLVVAHSALKPSAETPGPGHKPPHRKGPGRGTASPGKGQGRRKPRGG